MSNDKEDENLLHMTKEDLQRWIQAEVDRNPQLMQRREQLAQVEEWVKQKEREATYTRLLYSNACESVLECESVMKGLYGMLGLEYRDVDSEEEGGSVKEPQDVIHITDDEEIAKDNRGRDGGNLDVVSVDLGATKESLKPMLEKVTVAIQKSSRLIQDLVQMVNKETVSTVSSEASSDITTRPSSTSTPEASSSESVIPTQSPSPINQPISMTIPTESLDISDRSTAAIKTEPLLMAVTPSETALLPKSSEQFENIASHNFPSIAEFKTELQLTSITPSEMSLLLSNSEPCNTTASHDSPSMGAMKIEPQLAGITPEMSSLPGSSQQFETVASPSLASIVAIKTEPQLSIVTPFETSSLPDSTHQFETIVSRNSDSIVKTEPPMRPVSPEMSSLSSDSTPPEIIASYNSKFISSIKTEPQLTVLTPPEMSSLQSDSKQSKRIVGEDSASIATNMFESQRTAKSSSKTSSSPSSSEQCETITSNNSASTEKTTENAATRKKSTRSKANRKSSKTASSIVNTPSSQKETAQTSSLSDSISEPSDNEMPEPPDSIPQSSTNATPDSTTTKVMTGPSSSIKQPAAFTEPSDTRGSQASSNMSSKPGQVPTKEIVLKVNSEVLGKWNNKTWCQGRVENIKKTENGHKYNVQFKENKGQRFLPAHHVACVKPPLLKDLFIGCRLVACSKDDKGNTWYNAAVLAELPDRKNRMRFMVFFDDGRVSYVALPDLHLVCKQLKKVWKDIEEQSSRLRVKEYVRVYPTPIAVVLRIGQDTKAERNGKFEPCSVLQLDGSLIQICYKRDQFKEWVYKGSDKLEHIVNIKKRLAERKTQQPTKTAGTNLPQHNTTSASISVTPATVTSTAVTAETTPPIKVTPQADTTISKTHSITPRNAKSAKFQPKVVLQRLTGPCSIYTAVANDKIQTNLSVKRTAPTEESEELVSEKTHSQLTYMPHRCCSACLDRLRPSQVDEHRGQNPLLIPLLFKFRRMTARRRLEGKVYFHIFYRTPCGRSLCDMEEVQEYLFETRCDFLFLEMFCIDPFVLVNRARPPSISTSQPRLFLPDVSEGKEDVQVPCVNEVDETPAPIVKYTKDRVPAAGVSINTSLDFLIGCDCTDGCRDRSKCSCHQLTIGATSLCSGGPVDVTAGYTHKRLLSSLPTGLYECNPLCRCDPRTCSNRLVQHGLQLRLELFMTQHKGWGIRCKDDVAKGTFVCVFTGKIVTEDKMNEDDTVSGNEYLANLDFIEGVEKLKEGYESEAYCSDTEGEMNKKTITMKTGPLWKNTLFSEDSSSGEEKEEPMEIEQEEVVKKESKTVCESLSEKKMSPKLQEPSENALRNVTSLANKMRENGLETSGTNPKRCFAIKSTQRRVKPQGETEAQNEKTRKVQPVNNTRRLFNGEEACYIIDARQEGNLGRYINHSCSPNLFVQNVFVDTHDLRFPWVAFFASKRIKAGTELTWDYNYEVGSVEGKVLLCCCGSSRCTGRLL